MDHWGATQRSWSPVKGYEGPQFSGTLKFMRVWAIKRDLDRI
jgi:hypothetical protein